MARSPRRGDRGRPHGRVALAAALVAAFVVSPSAAGAASAAVAADDGTAQAAVDYLLDQQGADGGFGDAAVTPDAVAALAQQAQSSDTWSAKEAIDAVSAAETEQGATPLDALDAAAEADPTPDAAARMISRAVVAMGLDPENFDPGGEGDPVDLVHIVAAGRRADGSYGSLPATAEAVLALVMVDKPVNEATLGLLQDGQQRNGGWNATGDPEGTEVDPATTGLVIEALVAAGVPAEGDTPVTKALTFLARNQDQDGGWPAERGGEVDAVATAWAMGAIRASGNDPDQPCWRAGAAREGGYVGPTASIAAGQATDGALGTDAPVAASAVGVQGLLGRWLPTIRAPAVSCGGDSGGLAVPTSLIVLGLIAAVLVVGAVYIMRSGNR